MNFIFIGCEKADEAPVSVQAAKWMIRLAIEVSNHRPRRPGMESFLANSFACPFESKFSAGESRRAGWEPALAECWNWKWNYGWFHYRLLILWASHERFRFVNAIDGRRAIDVHRGRRSARPPSFLIHLFIPQRFLFSYDIYFIPCSRALCGHQIVGGQRRNWKNSIWSLARKKSRQQNFRVMEKCHVHALSHVRSATRLLFFRPSDDNVGAGKKRTCFIVCGT